MSEQDLEKGRIQSARCVRTGTGAHLRETTTHPHDSPYSRQRIFRESKVHSHASGVKFGVWNLGFKVQDSELRVYGLGFRVEVWGLGSRV